MVFLTFLYIFNFSLIKNVKMTESGFVVLAILVVYAVSNESFSRQSGRALGSSYNRTILRWWLLCFLYAFFIMLANLTFDFSFLSALCHQILLVEAGVMLYALIRWRGKNVIDVVIDSVLLQSFVQIASFISPGFLRVTDYFRNDDTIMKREADYIGYRGLAISGSSFFGLAVLYVILFTVLAFYWEKWKYKNNVTRVVLFCCISFGALSAGRTSVIGILAFFAIRFAMAASKAQRKKLFKRILQVFGACLLGAGIVYFADRYFSGNNAAWIRFKDYLLQFMQDEEGTSIFLRTRSTRNLFQDMYFELNWKQVLLGDGCYTNPDGTYYLHTDAGYMRNLLYFGIGGMGLLILYQMKILMHNVKTKYGKYFGYVMLAVLLVLEVKGQVVGFLISVQSILILICCALNEIESVEEDGTNENMLLSAGR